MLQIPSHPIGASDIDLVVTAIGKIKYAAIFKKPANDVSDSDVLRQTCYPGPEHADTTNNKIDLYSGIRSFIQLLDHLLIGQPIYLCHDMSRLARFAMKDFPVDERRCLFSQVDRSNKNLAVFHLSGT